MLSAPVDAATVVVVAELEALSLAVEFKKFKGFLLTIAVIFLLLLVSWGVFELRGFSVLFPFRLLECCIDLFAPNRSFPLRST